MSSQTQTAPYLPGSVGKGELAEYFGVHVNTLWRRFLTRELLESWGYSYEEDIKRYRLLDPTLTKKIYEHFEIENLRSSTV